MVGECHRGESVSTMHVVRSVGRSTFDRVTQCAPTKLPHLFNYYHLAECVLSGDENSVSELQTDHENVKINSKPQIAQISHSPSINSFFSFQKDRIAFNTCIHSSNYRKVNECWPCLCLLLADAARTHASAAPSRQSYSRTRALSTSTHCSPH